MIDPDIQAAIRRLVNAAPPLTAELALMRWPTVSTDRVGDRRRRPRYPRTMEPDPRTDLPPGDVVDERGVVITAAGRRRARAKLDAAAGRDPQERERARRDFLALVDAQR